MTTAEAAAKHASYVRCKDRRRAAAEAHEQDRQLVLQSIFEGLPSRQLARRLGLPLEAVIVIRAEERVRLAREAA